jgi:chromate transporter
MHRELVDRRRWISEERFLHALNYCMLLPGPEAQQLAIYIGWLMHRTWRGIVAGAFFVTPSIFILLASPIACRLRRDRAPYVEVIRGNPHLTAALSGGTAAVVGVVLNLALVFGAAVIWPHGLAGGTAWFAVLIGATAFALLYRYRVDVLWVVLGGGAIGLAARLLFGP